jgi:cell division protein FtsZ
VRGITDLMVMPGLINLDFADVRSVMQEMGKAMMGTGEAEGDDRAIVAAQKAIANPLLDGVSMQGAKGVIVSITGGEDMRLLEVDEAANHIRELVDPDANIIWGSAFNSDLEGRIRVSVVATGIETSGSAAQPQQAAPAAAPTRTFSFSAPRREEAPAPAAPQAAAAPAQSFTPDATDPLSFGKPDEPAAVPTGASAEALSEGVPGPDSVPSLEPAVDEDELLLGADAMVPEENPPHAEQAGGGVNLRRRLLAAEPAEEETAPQPRVKLGGTLFERMQNATRGAQRPADDNGGAPDLPRFLNRQNNQ